MVEGAWYLDGEAEGLLSSNNQDEGLLGVQQEAGGEGELPWRTLEEEHHRSKIACLRREVLLLGEHAGALGWEDLVQWSPYQCESFCSSAKLVTFRRRRKTIASDRRFLFRFMFLLPNAIDLLHLTNDFSLLLMHLATTKCKIWETKQAEVDTVFD